MTRLAALLFLSTVALSSCGSEAPSPAHAAGAPALEDAELGAVRNLHRAGDTWLAGQPAAEDFALLAEAGVRTVISLREAPEMEAIGDEARAAEAGLAFHNPGFREPETLTDPIFDGVRDLLNDEANGPRLLYCGSANRVGAVWLAHRVLDQGVELEEAVSQAKEVGLRNEEYEARARDYVARHSR